MRPICFCAALLATSPVAANALPQPGVDNPRVQSTLWLAGEVMVLTALPETPLTVLLGPGEQITRVTLNDDQGWAVKVSSAGDSFTVLPGRQAGSAGLTVETIKASYTFELQTGTGPASAYLVQLEYAARDMGSSPANMAIEPGQPLSAYALRGDRTVRPFEIFDDGAKTWITFAEDQAMPAVFAIGPSGEEQVVNGYMRGRYFVIDRVHEELVFRIDNEKAAAKRRGEGNGQ